MRWQLPLLERLPCSALGYKDYLGVLACLVFLGGNLFAFLTCVYRITYLDLPSHMRRAR